ncbi:MAG: c-type cytochrome [Flavobacteriales bacterium]|nr:c-type cytochrome [Flavobacteriales bacterium]
MVDRYSKFLLFLLIAFSSCRSDDDDLVLDGLLNPENGEELSGGLSNTVFNTSRNSFGQRSPFLDGSNLDFIIGNSFFNQSWVSAPASTTARDGLGPTFNARTCSSCHSKDGRGQPPSFGGQISIGFLLRLSKLGVSVKGGPLADPNYGTQLQDQSNSGVLKEGEFNISYTEIQGSFPDGEQYSLRDPTYTITNLNFGPLTSGIMVSPRIGQQMIGLGLLEAIDEADILLKEDQFDTNGDGISGKANYVWDFIENKSSLGRFGWKANQPSLLHQTAGAFIGDLGLTTIYFSNQNCPSPQLDCQQAAEGGTPEVETDDLNSVVLYVSNLAVPARRNYDNQDILKGKQLFNSIGCVSCHTPSHITGNHPKFNNLTNQKIWPYTDLLLHDMGDGLADNRPDYLADGNEWRTQALWGIGLIETVNNHTFLLHDGRARNIKEAILWHAGEAEQSKNLFKQLTATERELLINFIKTL